MQNVVLEMELLSEHSHNKVARPEPRVTPFRASYIKDTGRSDSLIFGLMILGFPLISESDSV